MGNTARGFLTAFYGLLLTIIVFINFVGWSGAYIDLSQASTGDWATNSYFGFSSVSYALNYLNTQLDMFEFLSIKNFIPHLNQLVNTITFGIPRWIAMVQSGDMPSVLEVASYIVNFFLQPVMVVMWGIVCLGHILWYFVCFVQVLIMGLSGGLNTQFDNMPSTSEFVRQVSRFAVVL